MTPLFSQYFSLQITDQLWTQEWAKNLRTAEDLYTAGFISQADWPKYENLFKRYRFSLPRYYASLIDRENPRCPIRLQAIPSLKEEESVPEETADPLNDLLHQPAIGITHRYYGRVLLHLTANCSMYCRYCFRKSLLNEGREDFFPTLLEPAYNYIENNPSVTEVILSGGDPLMASDFQIARVLTRLNEIEHVKRVRFHTRVPVTFPLRVTGTLVAALRKSRYKLVTVTHFNHPRELTEEATHACRQLSACSVLLNQSVLLKGVNDSAKSLISLSEGLFNAGVLPYYLHQLDPALGTRYFHVEEVRGKEIMREVREKLSGYLVPRYVVDKPEQRYKIFVV